MAREPRLRGEADRRVGGAEAGIAAALHDLEARIDLQPDALDRLRANNVLYDRQGSGEYFQIYTKTFDGGFFFELVERRAYAGFGAANAPIRLAAQTRLVRDPLSFGR